MANRLRCRITVNKEAVSFNGISGDGLLRSIDGPDLFGRAVALEFFPVGDDFRREFLRELEQRGLSALNLTPGIDQGDLVFTSDSPIPGLPYDLRLGIQGFNIHGTTRVFVEDSSTDAVIPIDLTVPTVSLTADPVAFDAKIRQVVMSSASRIDGIPAEAWLQKTNVDPQRKACVLNLLAKLRCVPDPNQPLIDQIDHIIAVQLERMYVSVSPDIEAPAGLLEAGDTFNDKQVPTSPTHQLLVRWIHQKMAPPATGQYNLKSYREHVTTDSMQVVVATPTSSGGTYADLDIDLGNPLTDLVGFSIHMQELTSDNVTDHLALFRDLSNDHILKQFLYYSIP